MSDLFKKKKCKAITKEGKPCRFDASICGYCVIHYNMMLGKIPEYCRNCPDKISCELLKRGDWIKCEKRKR